MGVHSTKENAYKAISGTGRKFYEGNRKVLTISTQILIDSIGNAYKLFFTNVLKFYGHAHRCGLCSNVI